MKQYIPKKPIKHGLKVWTWADSKNEFLSEFQVCVSKNKEAENGQGAKVIKNLTGTIVGKTTKSTVTIFHKIFTFSRHKCSLECIDNNNSYCIFYGHFYILVKKNNIKICLKSSLASGS